MSELSIQPGLKRDGTPQRRANQWTKQAERAKLTAEDHRQRIRVGMLLAKLESTALGKSEMNQSQVQAAKALLDKAIPTLQSVESMVIEVAANRSESDLLNDLREIIKQHPDLIQQLLAEQARSTDNPGPQSVVDQQQSVDAAPHTRGTDIPTTQDTPASA